MTPALLRTVVRVADDQTSDADLLTRFVLARDEPAFEELVRRHGPLVWTVCRQMLPHHADAEDAFQAVFLALIQGAGTIRAGQALPSWLHGVAVRVAEKAKRTSGRRKVRETRAAVLERDLPIPDAAWTTLMAAVHEEIQRLPDAERTAFILCDLEGVRQPDAAARLGWPLGTLSGRLCKARQRLIDQLTGRGIVPGVLAIGGLAGSTGELPAALASKVSSFPFALADGVSSSVSALAHGLVGGSTMRLKLLATALLVAGAVGLTGGSMILSNADAQPDPTQPGNGSPGGGGKVGDAGGRYGVQPGSPIGAPPGQNFQPGAGGGAPGTGGPSGLPGGPGMPGGMAPPGGGGGFPGMMMGGAVTAVDYKFVDLKSEDRESFEKEIKQLGTQGWEFCGSERLRKANEGAQLVLVFKKRHGADFPMGGMMAGGMGGGPAGMGVFGGGMGGQGGFGGGFAPGGGGMRPGGTGTSSSAPKPGDPAPKLPPGASAPAGPGPMGGVAGGFAGMSRGALDVSSEKLTVLKLKHAKAEMLAIVLQKVFARAEITAEPRTNQLIVRTGPETTKEVEKLVIELDVDVPPR